MKPRTVRRLCLVDGMDLDHIEGWLESMAARGLHYDHSDAFLFHFRQGGTGGGTLPAGTPWYPGLPGGYGALPHPGMGADRIHGQRLFPVQNLGTRRPGAAHRPGGTGVRAGQAGKAGSVVRHPMLICALVILALPLWLLFGLG